MESPSTSSPNSSGKTGTRTTQRHFSNPVRTHAGFSFIEIIVVIALIGIVATWGIIVGFNSFLRYNFRAETDTVVSLLQKARSSAINNISESSHGVYFGDANDLILFRGIHHDTFPAEHIRIEKSDSVTYDASACADDEVIFEQLSGRTAGCAIMLTNETQTISITTNAEGGVVW